MSTAVTHPQDHAHGHGDDHAHDHPHGWRRWLFATNHKDIGTLYLLFSFMMLLSGGTLALLIRLELFQPGLQFFHPELFNQFTTLHGLIMVFGAIMRTSFPGVWDTGNQPRSHEPRTGAEWNLSIG